MVKVTVKAKTTPGRGAGARRRDLTDALDEFRIRYPRALGAALYEEASAIFAESQLEVPVDTGRLRASGGVSPPIGRTDPYVRIFYGTDYALPVHERINVPHTVGKAKYLEDPFRRAIPGLLDRLAMRTMQHVLEETGNIPLLPTRPPPASSPRQRRSAGRDSRGRYTKGKP